ncbi:MAG: hypothetical protein ACRCZ0_08630 [Cetobacterium sp.]
MNWDNIEIFKNRGIKAKEIFIIKEISKSEAYEFIKGYHYLEGAKFLSYYSYGLFMEGHLVGCTTFSNPQGIATLKGWFGVDNQCKDILELSRLCIIPALNGSNATSYLLSNSLKRLKHEGIRAVITLADSSRHVGSIYQVCNFAYYGLTDLKSDFITWEGKVNPRGTTKGIRGVWLHRTRKHRYCYILDKKLTPKYTKDSNYPKLGSLTTKECCGGSLKVFDNRFSEWYTCPKCTCKMEKI